MTRVCPSLKCRTQRPVLASAGAGLSLSGRYAHVMSDTYMAYFARNNGRVFHDIGQEELDLYAGEPINELNWFGTRWIRVSDLRDGAAHYIEEDRLG